MGGTGGTSIAEDEGIDMLPRCPLLPTDDRWLLRRLADLRPALDAMILDLRTAETWLERRLLGDLKELSSPHLSIRPS